MKMVHDTLHGLHFEHKEEEECEVLATRNMSCAVPTTTILPHLLRVLRVDAKTTSKMSLFHFVLHYFVISTNLVHLTKSLGNPMLNFKKCFDGHSKQAGFLN